MLITLFIPVYNGEKYLRKTLDSVLKQTYSNWEALLVDDSSTDSSWDILQEYARKDSRITLYQKENGGMVAKSWNYILPKCNGEFLFYLSQDDILSEDILEKMWFRQQETQAEIVIPDLVFYFENTESLKKIVGYHGNRNAIISGKQAFLESLPWNVHGFYLFKTDLIQDELFPEDAFDSDEYVTRKLFLKAKNVAFSEGVFFYRQDNPEAITKQRSFHNFYQLNTSLKILRLLQENNCEEALVLQYKYALVRQFIECKMQLQNFDFPSEIEKNAVSLFLKSFSTHFSNSFFNESLSLQSFHVYLKLVIVRFIYNRDSFIKLVGKLRPLNSY